MSKLNNEDEEHYCDYCGSERVEKEGQFCSKNCAGGYWNDMNEDKDWEL